MAKLRIALYIHALAGGGAERVFALLASSLLERGHSVTIINDFPACENKSYLHDAVRQEFIGRRHIGGIAQLVRKLKSERPDVVVAALGAANLKMTVAHLLAGRKSALILTYHGRFETENRPLGQVGYIATPLLSRSADWVVANSKGLADYVINRYGAARGRTSYIYNPVFISKGLRNVNAAPLGARSDVVLAAGRLVPEKGFASLVRAFAKVSRRSARLIIIGEGPDRQMLEGEVTRLGLSDRVSFPGYVNEPWNYFETAKVFISSSSSEAFGNAIVEALAFGLPVVSTNCEGPEEILEHGQYGRIVPIGDVDALAAALDDALENPGDPKPRQDRASQYSPQAIASRYEILFDTILRAREEK
jgi:glycosyltransferase involved in cell wall biosynthesis